MFFESRTATPGTCQPTSTQASPFALKLLLRQTTSTQALPLALKLLFRQLIMMFSIPIEFDCKFANQVPRLSLIERDATQVGQDALVGGDLVRFLQEEAGCLAVQVGHRLDLMEVHQLERTGAGRKRADRRRPHPQSHISP